MDSGLSWLLVGLVAALLVTVLVAWRATVSAARVRRRLEDHLAASREDLSAVQRRLDALTRQVAAPTTERVRRRDDDPEFVITTAGLPDVPEPAEGDSRQPLSTRQFASVALGESLVTLASLGYGVRRALSAENRNRIGFEMRREVRRSRKQRRRDLKEAKRHLRAHAFDDHEDAA